jgi:hypothetical protein
MRAAAGLLLGAMAALSPAAAGGPVETSIFAVQGVEADVTSTDAAAAKNQALMDVQVKAFYALVSRLGSSELARSLEGKLKPEEIAPYLRSLSIEKETSAPGRYIGTFTVRFLPAKMKKFFEDYGVRLPERQADPVLILPVLRQATDNALWEDNFWRLAWTGLKGEQGLVPVIVPLGDLEDTETLTVDDALRNDPIKLEAIRKRYGAPSLLIAQAQVTDDGGLHVYIEGDTRLGKVSFNKIFRAADGKPESAAPAAAEKFQALLFEAYKTNESKIAADEAAKQSSTPQALAVTVPFTSPREWNAIRSRIINTPNVVNVDLSSLSVNGAVIKLVFAKGVDELQANLQRAGLNLAAAGDGWIIRAM